MIAVASFICEINPEPVLDTVTHWDVLHGYRLIYQELCW